MGIFGISKIGKIPEGENKIMQGVTKMIRKKLFVSIAGGLAALTLAAGLGMFPVSASTAYDTLIDDDFEASEELNAENWNALAEGSGASLSVTAKSILSYDLYHGNSIATKEKVTVAVQIVF